MLRYTHILREERERERGGGTEQVQRVMCDRSSLANGKSIFSQDIDPTVQDGLARTNHLNILRNKILLRVPSEILQRFLFKSINLPQQKSHRLEVDQKREIKIG